MMLFRCLVLCVMLIVPSPLLAESYSEKLERLFQADQEEALFKALLKQEQSTDDFVTALDFLKAKIVDDRVANSDYHAIYSMMLWKAGIKDTAASMAAAALLILQADQARCKDKTAGHMRLASRTTMLQDMIRFLIEQDKPAKDHMLGIALNIEGKIDQRSPNREICYSGIETTQKALKYAKEQDIELEKSGEESYVIPDFSHIKVEYLSGVEWSASREAIRNRFYSQMMTQ